MSKAARIGATLRADLVVTHQKREGIDRAIIKDPLTSRFYELAWEDYLLATHLRAGMTVADVVGEWKRAVPELCKGDLNRRAVRLCEAVKRLQLCERVEPVGSRRVNTLSWGAWLASLAKKISAPLFVRLHLADPDHLLSVLVERFSPLFSRTTAWLAAAFVLLTWLVFLNHLPELQFRPEWFLVWENLLGLYAGILVLKVIHESGHALVCKAMGGHVHEVGAQLLVFHPTFYVDVSDTWTWPERRRRIAVAAAGFAFEIVAAAVLFWIWLLLAPGFLRDLCLNLVYIATVSAVLFNANPLMRYDGYYMLADLLREPNLRQRAFASVGRTIRRWVFGSALIPAANSSGRTLVLGLYGVLSSIYLAWIVIVVSGFLKKLLEPVGLAIVGQVIFGAWLVSVLVPVLRFVGELWRETAQLASKTRPLIIAALLPVLVLSLLFVPLPLRVQRLCVIEAGAAGVMRSAQSGFVSQIHVSEGDVVKKDQLLVVLRNEELELSCRSAELNERRASAEFASAVGESKSERVRRSLHELNEARANLAAVRTKLGQLEMRSPCDGVVLSRHLERRRGLLVRPGEEVLSVAPASLRQVMLPLDEQDARRVRAGAEVKVYFKCAPWELHQGRISAEPLRLGNGDVPKALSAIGGGEVALDAQGRVLASDVTHMCRFDLHANDPRLRPGLTGRARIDCGSLPLGLWLWERLMESIHLDHRV